MFKLDFKVNNATRELRKLEQTLLTHADKVVVPYYFQHLQRIAAEAVQVAKVEIKLATTKTGLKRAATGGGEPGRIVSRKFYDSLTWKVAKQSKGVYTIRIGWLDGSPDWASYQELGFQHRSGMYVTGVDALGAAQRYVNNEIGKLQ